MAYAMARLLHLSFFVKDQASFHASTPIFLFVVGTFFCIAALLAIDYLCYRKYHLKHGTIARIQGIIRAPGISAERKLQLLEHESLQLENFQQRI